MAVSLSLSIVQNSQNIENNTSNVTVNVYASWTYGSWNAAQKPGYVIIDGAQFDFTSSFNTGRSNTGSQIICSRTVTIYHAADGTKTLSCSASYTTGVSSGTIYASDSIALTTIPRATTPVLSVSSTDMGQTVQITLNRATSTFIHALSYAFGNLTEQTAGLSASSGVATSATFTPPLTLANQIPNSTSGTCTITCKTYNGLTLIGTKTVSLTLTVPETVVPVISNVSISEATSGIAQKFSAYVQSKSTLAVSISASGVSGSTISSYETTIENIKYNGASITSQIISGQGTITVYAKVVDTRGRIAQTTRTVTVLAYSPPQISEFSAWRITTAGVQSDEGNRVATKAKYAISSVGNRNDHTYTYKYKRSGEENFTTFASGSADWQFDAEELFTSFPNISPDYAHIVRLEIADYFQTVAYEVQLPTASTIMDFRYTGKGMAIGKVSEKDAFEVDMPTEFDQTVSFFDNVSVDGDSTFAGSADFAGDADFAGNVAFAGNANFQGEVSMDTPLPLASGGLGASTAEGGRDALDADQRLKSASTWAEAVANAKSEIIVCMYTGSDVYSVTIPRAEITTSQKTFYQGGAYSSGSLNHIQISVTTTTITAGWYFNGAIRSQTYRLYYR